jgi:antitoxin component of MazEF toxin-antitoxin module
MKIKTRLHASQLYLPKDFLEKLSLNKESEITLELDEENKRILIHTPNSDKIDNPTEWVLNAMANLPVGKGNLNEDMHEYNYDDI